MIEEPKTEKPKTFRTTLYMPWPLADFVRKVAYEQRRKQHELMLEALYEWAERKGGKTREELTEPEHAAS